MTVAPFEAAEHHIGLGLDDDHLLGFFVAGSYHRKLVSPIYQSPQQLGPEALIGEARYSTWTQNDYTGGEFAYDWKSEDQAQFSDCLAMQPDPLARSIRTCRPLVPEDIGPASPVYPMSMDVVRDRICVVYRNSTNQGRIFTYKPATGEGAYNNINGLASGSWPYPSAASWNQATETLWVAVPYNGSTSATNKIWTFRFNADGILEKFSEFLGPVDNPVVTTIKRIHLFGQVQLLIGESTAAGDNDVVYQFASGSGPNATWNKVGRVPGQVVDTATYNNQTYILSRSPGSRSYISMTDGSTIFPVYSFPYAFKARRMVEYAGRLYIIGTGADVNDSDIYGELYEVNGTSARLVRTFAPELRRPPPAPGEHPPIRLPWHLHGPRRIEPGAIRFTDEHFYNDIKLRIRPLRKATAIAIFEGLLYFPDDDGGLEVYDYTTDALYGGPILPRAYADESLVYSDAVSFGNHLYLWGVSNLVGKTGLYRTLAAGDTSPPFEAHITTSDFAPEPSRDKIWGDVVALTRYKLPSLLVSTDAGQTWQQVTDRVVREIGYRFETRWSLSQITPGRSIRLKFAFPMDGTAEEQMGEMLSHTLSYLVKGDPRRIWSFTIPAAEYVGGIDENQPPERNDVAGIISTVWGWVESGTALRYRDIDGATYDVVLNAEQRNVVIDEQREAFFQVTLTEI